MTATQNDTYQVPMGFDGYSGFPVPSAVYGLTTSAPAGQPGMWGLANTSSATALGTLYPFQNLLTLSATGITSGNAFASRPVVTMSGTVTGGAYIFAERPGLVLSGTQNHADSRMGVIFAKLDASAGVYTAGQLSAAWFDMGSTAPTGGWATGGQANVVRLQNTTGSAINALLYGYGKATYGFDLSDNGSGWLVASGSGTTGAGAIKVNINGATRYINLYSTAP